MGGCRKRSLPPLFPREIASKGGPLQLRADCELVAEVRRRFEQIHVHVCDVAHYAVAVTRDGLYLSGYKGLKRLY